MRSFNRRRDACFLATHPWYRGPSRYYRGVSIADATLASSQQTLIYRHSRSGDEFQSQTRRLLPRNAYSAPLASPTIADSLNRRRDACFLATKAISETLPMPAIVSIADATLASSQQKRDDCRGVG